MTDKKEKGLKNICLSQLMLLLQYSLNTQQLCDINQNCVFLICVFLIKSHTDINLQKE